MSRKKAEIKKAYTLEIMNGTGKVTFLEPLTISNANLYDKIIYGPDGLKDLNILELNFKSLDQYDSYLILFLNSLREKCNSENIKLDFIGLSDDAKAFITALDKKVDDVPDGFIKRNWFFRHLEFVGSNAIRIFRESVSFIEFFGDLLKKMLVLIFRPGRLRWGDFLFLYSRSGVSALPIVLLIVFLIGLVIGYQGAVQLHQFGADTYISYMVGLSITRELGPLMTAIIIAGRSGSSFAAEIGTMKVSEEVDALNSMGFDHITFIVVPRVLAVFLAMPFLTILADLAGVLGGLTAAMATLNITITGYVNGLQGSLDFFDVFSGIGKAMIFGFFIATVGCFMGMQVRGGAESVGKFTTSSVVTGIFLIILIDALFAFMFTALGI